MRSDTLKRLAVALGALVLIWAALSLWRRTGRDTVTRLSFARIDTAHVDTIIIRHQTDTVRLARTGATWTVNGFAAAGDQVKELLGALGDTAVRGELVAENASSQATLGVDSASARWLTVKAGSNAVVTYAAGHRDASYDGMYVRRPGEAATYDLHARLGEYIEKSVSDWRDKRIATVATDSVQRIEVQRGRSSYALTKQGNAWMLGTTAADSSIVARLLGAAKAINATGFATARQADSANFKVPDRRLVFAGVSGKKLLELVFDSTASGFWVRRDSLPTVFQLDLYAANQLTPPDSSLRKKH